MTMNTHRIALAAIIALLSTAPAFADQFPDEQVRQLTVSYAGLDLNTPAGAALLYKRITAAAKAVCDQTEPAIPSQRRLN
jgi:UrcA family protein